MSAVLVVLALSIAAPASAASYGAVAWGQNTFRQLGDGGIETLSDLPVPVSGLSGVSAVSAGGLHSLALLSDGTVVAWGDDEYGQLGDGSVGGFRDTPVAVSGLSAVTAIAAGATHSLALLSNGTVMAWGDNEYGELGNATTKESDLPVAVHGLSGVKAISAGGGHSLALLSNGTVMAWGDNEYGELGDASTKNSDVPVAVHGLSGVTAIAAGSAYSVALLGQATTVMAWGEDNSDQLGDTALKEPKEEEELPEYSDVPVAVSGLSGVSAISAGANHCLALLSGATVVAWGANTDGQLGNGITGGLSDVPVAVSGLSKVTAVSAGSNHSMALLSSGAVMTWGENKQGQLGNGTVGEPSDVPVAVSALAKAVGISAGGAHDLAFGEPIPAVTGVSPSSGAATGGATVSITGANFTGATAVKFGSSDATEFKVSSATSITAVAPAGTGTVDITVTSPTGTSHPGPLDRFSYLAPPAVKKLSPKSGPAGGGTVVTITGSGFTGATAVKFGSTNAIKFTVSSATAITAVAPAGSVATVDVAVTTPIGPSAISPHDRFKYTPSIERVSPDSGSTLGGSSVTITGSGFAVGTTATTFKFGTASAKVAVCSSSTTCTVMAPAHAVGVVDVRAKVDKQSSPIAASDRFTYE